jgi:Domain of unknown function (DUF4397)
MKRLIVGAVVVLAAAFFAGAPTSGAGVSATTVNLLHGVGPGPDTVDVYVAPGVGPSEWDLLADDVDYTDFLNTGDADAGDYNFLVCTAVAAPLDTITGCADNGASSVNGNFGTDVTIPAVDSVTVVIAYAGLDEAVAGRPTVVVFEDDLDCVATDETGRLAINHAAALSDVNVLVDGTEEFSDVAFGEGGDLDLAAGSYDVEITNSSDDSSVVDDSATVEGATSTVLYAVGNPQFDAPFELLAVNFPLDGCDQPTTTTTTAPAPLPVTPNAPVQAVTPAFTG